MTRCWRRALLLLLLLTGFGKLPVAAQSSASLRPQDDARPELQISVPAKVFHQGELIPLILSFTSKTSNRYQINMACYDRSGRMGYEKFLIEPAAGTTDPLTVYFKSAGVLMSGAFTNFKYLSDSPYLIHLDLNEWIRFDASGHYRLTVTSRRVSDVSGGKSFYQGVIQELKSNTIDLEVVEAKYAWQQTQLEEVLLDLDHVPSEPSQVSTDFKCTALRRLRYLGSEDAARELARRMTGTQNNTDWNSMLGLIGSPNRMVGLDEMNKLLGSPDFPVTQLFFNTLAIIPLDPNESGQNLLKLKESNLLQVESMLLSKLALKRGQARAASVDTAVHNLATNVPTGIRGGLVAQLIENFNALPKQKQIDWLGRDWASVRNPQWLPVVRTLAVQDTDLPRLGPVTNSNESIELTGLALTRWYELDPQNAREVVLAEIVRPQPRFGSNTLGILPDAILLDQQDLIAGHFVAFNRDIVGGNLATLLNRYADKSVLPKVLAAIEQNAGRPWECVVLQPTLAYVAKVDPDKAKTLTELRKNGVTACDRIDWWFGRP